MHHGCMSRLPSTTALLCLEAAARLGTALFVRQRDALCLTDAGQAYLLEVRPALASLERATAGVMALQGRGGPLTLSVASSLGNHWLIPRLPDFTRQHPQITLNIATRVGPADFAAGRLDASLEDGDGQRPGLHDEFLLPLTLVAYAAPAWVRWFAAAGLQAPSLSDGPRHDLMSMALNAALVGLGVALLPDFMTGDAVARRRLVRLAPLRVRAEGGYWLVLLPANADRPPVRALREWLRAQVAAT